MILPKTKTSASRARTLRKRSTPEESLLWRALRGRRIADLKFRRQVPCGHYILDFYCAEQRLCIEIDGGHHSRPAQSQYDLERSRYLAALEIRVLRFSTIDVRRRCGMIIETIERSTVVDPHPDPLPPGEGEKKRR